MGLRPWLPDYALPYADSPRAGRPCCLLSYLAYQEGLVFGPKMCACVPLRELCLEALETLLPGSPDNVLHYLLPIPFVESFAQLTCTATAG